MLRPRILNHAPSDYNRTPPLRSIGSKQLWHILSQTRPDVSVHDQQYDVAGVDYRHNVQTAMASRIVFKWIKQQLRIKRFIGSSENAAKTRIWFAIATYVAVFYR